jgi:hypothetical protein
MDTKLSVVPGVPNPAAIKKAISSVASPGPQGLLQLHDGIDIKVVCQRLTTACEPVPGRPTSPVAMLLAKTSSLMQGMLYQLCVCVYAPLEPPVVGPRADAARLEGVTQVVRHIATATDILEGLVERCARI